MMDNKERGKILTAMLELHALLTQWGVRRENYFYIDRVALRLQGFMVPLNDRGRQDFCIGALEGSYPWFSKSPEHGFEETPPPAASQYAHAVNDFTVQHGFEVHFYLFSEPKYRWRQNYVGRVTLPNGVEVRLNTLYGTTRGLAEDMLPYCTPEGIGYEKGVRMLQYVEDMRAIARDVGDVAAVEKADEVLKEFAWIRDRADAERIAATTGGQELHGTPAFPGVVRGTVFVVRDIMKDIPKAPCIVVTEKITPAFYAYRDRIQALIVDHGGLTSHAAILARECKIPTIVGAITGMARLQAGDTIIIDATTGSARIVERVRRS